MAALPVWSGPTGTPAPHTDPPLGFQSGSNSPQGQTAGPRDTQLAEHQSSCFPGHSSPCRGGGEGGGRGRLEVGMMVLGEGELVKGGWSLAVPGG